MEGRTREGVVRVEGNARERFYDSRGYGRPDGPALELAPVEAAHLLYRGDLDAVDGRGFRDYLASEPGLAVRFLVYADLRNRGFYLAPTERDGEEDATADHEDTADLHVFPRGKGPWDDEVAYRVRVVGERAPVPARTLGDATLAVVDEESEITYLGSYGPDVSGTSDAVLPERVPAAPLGDRVAVWDAPAELYERGFYGQPLDDDAGDLQLSLLEAAHLAERGALDVPGGPDAVVERGRAVEGDRFDRRLAVYRDLRRRGVVPKTGFKFGADFRTYADVTSVKELGHSELLVRVLPTDHVFRPRDLALDVRLAHGVRKTMAFALTDGGTVEWLAVERLTP
ncbi:tRNA-intron lyase [Halobacteriales archaeon QS_5_70_15]|nr:MAG: tRNA-intron lyase [Halobacteriales archaeon QS_5_70_15]